MRIKIATKIFGERVERQASDWLIEQGLTLITRNYLCKSGEIDIIMEQDNCLVFIEVRYRKQVYFGSPAETITLAKQNKVRLAAEHFLLAHSQHQRKACRFDVIAAQPANSGDRLHFDWIRNAF
jgi:putative endonuclease